MANASFERPRVVQPPATITLTLSEEEAQALYDIIRWHVNGSGKRRDLINKIHDAFQVMDNGNYVLHQGDTYGPRDIEGYVRFSDEPRE